MPQRRRPSGLRRALLAGVLALAAAITPSLTAAAPAQAAPVVGFDAGNIISDALFYQGDAMTAAQVQSFLNQRVTRCTIGDAGRKPGQRLESGNIIANSCLKDFRMTTTSKAATAYCSSYVGVKDETAAQIIAKVGKACGISPKVLIVMLQKEQSLITDTWPTTRMYDFALGLDCPDSGPGGTANCNSGSSGFFNQVYGGAHRLKYYTGNPGEYRYKPYQSNTIQWHPNIGCGTSQVYIANRATAALYIYTPYRPNQAALNAGSGTGDSCSTYGNRNFFIYYTSWFGDTGSGGPAYPLTSAVRTYWDANRSWLGQPTGPAGTVKAGANGSGRLQYFTGGFVYESDKGKPVGFTKNSPIVAAYGKAGGIEGSWGWPLSPAVSHGSGNAVVRFQGGTVVEAKGVGVYLIPEKSRVGWEHTGGFTGSIGYPTAAAASVAGGTTQKFQKGDLYTSSAGTFDLPNGQLRTSYVSAGGPSGSWGWPSGRYVCVSDGSECSAVFTKGVGVWTKARGVLFTPYSGAGPQSDKPSSGESVTGGVVQG